MESCGQDCEFLDLKKIIFKYFFAPCGKFRLPYLGKAQQPQEQRYPFLSVCEVFPCVQTMVWLSVFKIFNMCTDVDACVCTRGLFRHCKRVCTGRWLWEKNPLPHWELKPTSVLCLAFQSDTLPTELSPPLTSCTKLWNYGQVQSLQVWHRCKNRQNFVMDPHHFGHGSTSAGQALRVRQAFAGCLVTNMKRSELCYRQWHWTKAVLFLIDWWSLI